MALPQPQPIPELSDADLMVRVQAGDRDAFGTLVDRHKNAIIGYLTRMTGCRSRAEDLAQDTFVRLYQIASRYQETGHLLAYIYRIATNLLRSEERKERRRQVLFLGFLYSNERASAPSPQAEVLEQERQTLLATAVGELPLRYREPLVKYEVEGWSYREIADSMGCREGTVKSRISRARQQLKERLAPYRDGVMPT